MNMICIKKQDQFCQSSNCRVWMTSPKLKQDEMLSRRTCLQSAAKRERSWDVPWDFFSNLLPHRISGDQPTPRTQKMAVNGSVEFLTIRKTIKFRLLNWHLGSGCSTAREHSPHNQPLRQLSLKIHYVEFNITVPPCKLYVKNLTSKITMRPYNSLQMSIRRQVLMSCSPKIT